MIRIAAVLLLSTSLGWSAAPAVEVGKPAPDFALMSQAETLVKLSDFKGHWVVLYFYPKDFTKGCTIEAHNFQRDIKKYEAKDAVILGVSVQDTTSHKSFCVKEGLSFKLLADTEEKVSKLYDSLKNYGLVKWSARHTFLIDPEGNLAKAYTDVDPKTHSDDVLADLASLQAAKKAPSHK